MREPTELERIETRPLWPNPYIDSGPVPVAVVPRWWFTTDERTMGRLRFLPDYAYQGEAIVVGMRVAWEGGEMELCADRATGEYFRRIRTGPDEYLGRVFAPAPPPVGLWSGEGPFMNEGDDHV